MKEKEYEAIFGDDEIYYKLDRLLSHNADISWSQSIRNLGKSYDAMRLVGETMKAGRNCVWLRWSKSETELAKTVFEEFLGDKERYKSMKIPDSSATYITDIETGAVTYFMPVKMANDLKGLDIPELKWIVYDECVPEFYDVKTRRDVEFDKFMSLYKTLKRDCEDTRVIMICNCIDWFTGYTLAWGITPFESGVIKSFTKEVRIEVAGEVYSTSNKISFENVRPSKGMILRNLKDESLKGNAEELEQYYANATQKKYTAIAICPDLNISLGGEQFRRGKSYYSYRYLDGYYYFCKTGKRTMDVTHVGTVVGMQDNERKLPSMGKSIEELINRGVAKFDTGHTYNAIVGLVWDYRKRV